MIGMNWLVIVMGIVLLLILFILFLKISLKFTLLYSEMEKQCLLQGVTISFWENCTFRHILDTNQPIPCTLRNRLLMLNSK
ncbi:hypothetical protein F8171_15305 [Bacillus cereus]|nr:hypothetical protein F8171_15305 [Bacillus cereus]